MKYDYDVLVIGLGPAGMAVTAMASHMGLSVCAIEKNKVGVDNNHSKSDFAFRRGDATALVSYHGLFIQTSSRNLAHGQNEISDFVTHCTSTLLTYCISAVQKF